MHGASCCHTPGILSCTLVLLPSLSCILTSLLGGAHPFLPSLLGPRVCDHSINMEFDALRRFARQVLSRRCILRRCLHRLTRFHINHCDAGVYFLAEGHYHFCPWMMYTQYPLDMRRSETIHLPGEAGCSSHNTKRVKDSPRTAALLPATPTALAGSSQSWRYPITLPLT